MRACQSWIKGLKLFVSFAPKSYLAVAKFLAQSGGMRKSLTTLAKEEDLSRQERFAALRPYTVREVAELLGLSPQTVTRLFENEPGVLILNRPTRINKRRYRSLRIPHAVYERVRARLSKR